MFDRVSPYTGEWIEILHSAINLNPLFVSPYTGEWIEILILSSSSSLCSVSPYTGEWIEIFSSSVFISKISRSHLTQVSGLK